MSPGDVVIASLPQSDGTLKLRPAVLLSAMPPYGDWLACGVSTQLHHHVVGFDELLPAQAPDFSSSGLRQASLIRLGFVSTLPRAQIGGALGKIDSLRLQRLLARLARHLAPQP
jgi:mRNA interferase MazF